MRRRIMSLLAGGLAVAASAPAWAGSTQRVSVSSAGKQGNDASLGPLLSDGGRFVAFESSATNLAPGDTNGDLDDVFVRDRLKGTTEQMSVSSTGVHGNLESFAPSISAGGRFVAFTSLATNLVPGRANTDTANVYVRDRLRSTTERVSVSSAGAQGNIDSVSPSISAGGRFVAFTSLATNLVPGDTNGAEDVFVRDRRTGRTERVSVSSRGVQGNGGSGCPSISAGGRFVAFDSYASNLVPGDTNGLPDVFVRDRLRGTTERMSIATGGGQAEGDNGSSSPSISAGGWFVAFDSYASNLVPGDTNGRPDVFVRTR